jgi:hypothetical protein
MQKKNVSEILVQTALILDNLEINPKVHSTVLNYTVVLSQIQICPLLAKKAHFQSSFPQISKSFLVNIQLAYTPKSEQKRASFSPNHSKPEKFISKRTSVPSTLYSNLPYLLCSLT